MRRDDRRNHRIFAARGNGRFWHPRVGDEQWPWVCFSPIAEIQTRTSSEPFVALANRGCDGIARNHVASALCTALTPGGSSLLPRRRCRVLPRHGGAVVGRR